MRKFEVPKVLAHFRHFKLLEFSLYKTIAYLRIRTRIYELEHLGINNWKGRKDENSLYDGQIGIHRADMGNHQSPDVRVQSERTYGLFSWTSWYLYPRGRGCRQDAKYHRRTGSFHEKILAIHNKLSEKRWTHFFFFFFILLFVFNKRFFL